MPVYRLIICGLATLLMLAGSVASASYSAMASAQVTEHSHCEIVDQAVSCQSCQVVCQQVCNMGTSALPWITTIPTLATSDTTVTQVASLPLASPSPPYRPPEFIFA